MIDVDTPDSGFGWDVRVQTVRCGQGDGACEPACALVHSVLESFKEAASKDPDYAVNYAWHR
jgi:hypothetical protein